MIFPLSAKEHYTLDATFRLQQIPRSKSKATTVWVCFLLMRGLFRSSALVLSGQRSGGVSVSRVSFSSASALREASEWVREGREAEQSSDLERAVELYQRARVRFHEHAQLTQEADTVLGLARCFRDTKNVSAMLSHLREYLRLKGEDHVDDEQLAWISYELGYHGYVTGDYGTAIRHLQAARLHANVAGKKTVEAWSMAYLGSLYARHGDVEKGLQMLQRGATLAQQVKDHAAERQILLMLASTQQQNKLLDDALASYSKATVLARNANDIKGEARIYRLAGAVLQEKGDLRSALNSFKVAVKLSDQSGDKISLISSSLAAGNVMEEISKLSAESVVYWKQALHVCKELKVRQTAR
jgi:tetratricopeptide (TPR) repeat protein